jgi:hypothetical protein
LWVLNEGLTVMQARYKVALFGAEVQTKLLFSLNRWAHNGRSPQRMTIPCAH